MYKKYFYRITVKYDKLYYGFVNPEEYLNVVDFYNNYFYVYM